MMVAERVLELTGECRQALGLAAAGDVGELQPTVRLQAPILPQLDGIIVDCYSSLSRQRVRMA